jgi:Na+/melibiose symporter-like transporter
MWNLTVLAIIISVGWLALIAYYIILSRQHNSLQQELDELTQLLEEKEAQRAVNPSLDKRETL